MRKLLTILPLLLCALPLAAQAPPAERKPGLEPRDVISKPAPTEYIGKIDGVISKQANGQFAIEGDKFVLKGAAGDQPVTVWNNTGPDVGITNLLAACIGKEVVIVGDLVKINTSTPKDKVWLRVKKITVDVSAPVVEAAATFKVGDIVVSPPNNVRAAGYRIIAIEGTHAFLKSLSDQSYTALPLSTLRAKPLASPK